jgi:tetratricopeptide (TPR) repeat protein
MDKTTPVISNSDPRRWYQKKNVVIDIAVIVAVLVIIGIIWWVGHRPKAEPVSKVPQYSGQSLVDAVNKKTGENDYGGAIALLKGQKSAATPSTQLLLASAYANEGNITEALKIYDDLNKSNSLSVGSLAAAAEIAEKAGNDKKALEYYKAAVSKLQADTTPSNNDTLPAYQAKVSELEKKVTE